LSVEGYAVRTFDGRWQGSARDPDLIIADVYMPRHLGIDRLRSVQSAFPGVPIIAISGQFRSGLCGDGPAARELGVRQVIAKPFGRTQLLMAVRAVAGPVG
jgi:DNA-binding response OmpR family regulator